MISETQAPFSLEDLRQNFERLQADLHIVQNELDQALGVWRSILTTEKQEFKKLLEDHRTAWDRDDQQWEKDRAAYEQKIKELEEFFNKQLTATEQNAVRALNELDSAWQQERQRWQLTLTQHTKESRQREDLQNATHQQLQQRVSELQDENAQLQSHLTQTDSEQGNQQQELLAQIASLESQVANWEAEKAIWQQSYSEQVRLHQEAEDNWTEERRQQAALIQSLQQDLVTLEARLRASERSHQAQQQQLGTYITSLEKQVTTLNDFLQQVMPMHPLRRKTDLPDAGSSRNVSTAPPRAAY